MKYVLLALAVVVLLWMVRASLRGRGAPPGRPADGGERPLPMLACAQCGIHLPRDEALPGRGGVFCGDSHRAAFERAHPE